MLCAVGIVVGGKKREGKEEKRLVIEIHTFQGYFKINMMWQVTSYLVNKFIGWCEFSDR